MAGLALALALAACSETSPPPAPHAVESAAQGPDAAPPDASADAAADAPGATTSQDEPQNARPSSPGEGCSDRPELAIFTSPRTPHAGAPLRIIAVAEKSTDATLTVFAPDGKEVARSDEPRPGPPAWWFAEIPAAKAGTYRAVIGAKDRTEACEDIAVEPEAEARTGLGAEKVWPIKAAWGKDTENLYSAWIERLFDAPLEEQPSWPALHEVLRDPARNFLHDHLGWSEDNDGPKAISMEPDCADLPYYLRAYFAFKMGLPFGFSACTRGQGSTPPACLRWHSNLEVSSPSRRGPAVAFGKFLRVRLADVVHSGNGRAPLDRDDSDYYSVPLTTESLRPGAVYADPYGHMLVVTRRIPQTDDQAGVLLAVDGQPDGTVARRRYWRGNFLFAVDPALGGPGFKRFRPVVVEGRKARALSNDEIARSPVYGDFSTEQQTLGVDGFYDRMDEVLSPRPLDPARAMRETIQALEEQVRVRVLSVQNGQKHFASAGAEIIEMPEDAAIFETTGPWEDFSTPSRDLRLLIAIDIVLGFPERVARQPARFAMPATKAAAEVKEDLARVLRDELAARRVTYQRSDGSPFTLSLADVAARAAELEMAYNPNDCVEVRWGAPARSDEAKTCRRRAPADQRARMRRYRTWFHERRRPPRT